MKPKQFEKSYGDQFSDQSVVDCYHLRPVYPKALFNYLTSLLPKNGRVLDLGCGTGALAIGLAKKGLLVDAVDPSAAMIKRGKSLAESVEVNWVVGSLNSFDFSDPYDLIVCANSVQWLDWPSAFPIMKQYLKPEGKLAIIDGGDLQGFSGQDDVLELVKCFSTNQDFKPYDIVSLLQEQGWYHQDQEQFFTCSFDQAIEDFVLSIHSRNGFSLDRMEPKAAEQFDQQVSQVLQQKNPSGLVKGEIAVRLSLGQPQDLPADD